jgi:hypothetical protein
LKAPPGASWRDWRTWRPEAPEIITEKDKGKGVSHG